jgi:hypothetical protein
MPYRDTIVDMWQAGGDAPAKIVAGGAALLVANIWNSYLSIAFGAVLVFAIADFVTGVARSFAEHGMYSWSDRKAINAGLKLAVAVAIVAVTVTGDTLFHATDTIADDKWPLLATGCTIMSMIYLGSIGRNADYFFPGLGDAIQRALHHHTPHDRRQHDAPEQD